MVEENDNMNDIKLNTDTQEEDSNLSPETRTLLDEDFWRDATPQKVEELLANGADINAQNKRGMTAAHYAAELGDPALIRLLGQHGADMNIGDIKAETPAHKVARNAHGFDALKTMAEFNADFNQTTMYGESVKDFVEKNYQEPDKILDEIDAIQQKKGKNADYIRTDGPFTYGKKGNMSWFSNTGNSDKMNIDADESNSLEENFSNTGDPNTNTERNKLSDGTLQEVVRDNNGQEKKITENYSDGSRATREWVTDSDILQTNEFPDGTIMTNKVGKDYAQGTIDHLDGSKTILTQTGNDQQIQAEFDANGKVNAYTYLDKDGNPLLREEHTEDAIQYLKQDTHGQWQVMPDNGEDDLLASTDELEKLKNMSPEEVEEILKKHQEELSQPENNSLSQEESENIPQENSVEQQPIQPETFTELGMQYMSKVKDIYTAGSEHSIINNVEQIEGIASSLQDTLQQGSMEGKEPIKEENISHLKEILEKGSKAGKTPSRKKQKDY